MSSFFLNHLLFSRKFAEMKAGFEIFGQKLIYNTCLEGYRTNMSGFLHQMHQTGVKL